MPLRDGAAVRRELLQMIVEMVRGEPGVHIAKIKVLMAMRTGLTKRRVFEYVGELVEGGLLVEKESRFWVAGRR